MDVGIVGNKSLGLRVWGFPQKGVPLKGIMGYTYTYNIAYRVILVLGIWV